MNISGPLTNPELDQEGTEEGTQNCPTLRPVVNRTSYSFIKSWWDPPRMRKAQALVNMEPMAFSMLRSFHGKYDGDIPSTLV